MIHQMEGREVTDSIEYTYLTVAQLIDFLRDLPSNKIIGIPRPGLEISLKQYNPSYSAKINLAIDTKDKP